MSVIVEVKNLTLTFPIRLHQVTTARDSFIKAVGSPLEFFFKPRQRLEVLRGLSLTIKRGERIALIGVNGTGKTTFCRVLSGTYSPSGGQVRINGQVRAIFDTMVGIFPELTGRENASILVSLLYPSLKKQQKDALLADALEFTELGAFLDTPFKFYSNGMQTRLCLSVLTMLGTDLLILDEVFEGADQFFREKISKRVLKMIETSGAVVFVSHAQDQLRRVCTRGIVLRDGRIAFDGGVNEALEFYQNSYVQKNG